MPFESLGIAELKNSEERLKPSIEKAPTLELKPLPDHLRYEFLGDESTLHVVIAANLTGSEERKTFAYSSRIQRSYWMDFSRYQGN